MSISNRTSALPYSQGIVAVLIAEARLLLLAIQTNAYLRNYEEVHEQQRQLDTRRVRDQRIEC